MVLQSPIFNGILRRFNLLADSSPPADMPPPGAVAPEMMPTTSFPNNPGTFEDLFGKIKIVEPQCFDGLKLVMNKPLSSHFQVSHTMTLPPDGKNPEAGYRFGALFAGKKMLSQTEAYPLLMGDIDPNGSVNATMLNTFFSPRFRIKAIGRFEKNDLANCQATADWRGDRYTLSLTAANVDLREQSFVGVAHLLGGVTKNLSIGGEIVLQGSPQIPGGFMALPGLGGKYSTDAWTASLSVNPASFHTMYFHQVSKLLQIGVDWQISLRGQEPESVAKIAYHFDMQPAGVAFRGEVSSEWTILATMEKQLGAAPISFVMSCAMSVISRATKVGIGLIVGQG